MNPSRAGRNTLLVVSREGMGDAEPALCMKLLRTYLTLLLEGGMLPGAIALYAEGVRIAVEGSPVLDLLAALESQGVHIILCKTCLDHFGLAEHVKHGVIGGMPDIISAQWAADKVITL